MCWSDDKATVGRPRPEPRQVWLFRNPGWWLFARHYKIAHWFHHRRGVFLLRNVLRQQFWCLWLLYFWYFQCQIRERLPCSITIMTAGTVGHGLELPILQILLTIRHKLHFFIRKVNRIIELLSECLGEKCLVWRRSCVGRNRRHIPHCCKTLGWRKWSNRFVQKSLEHLRLAITYSSFSWI